MGLSFTTQGLIVLIAASVLAVGQARTIAVGGSQGWRSGFNYTAWALQNQPFYYGDTLVFKYSKRAGHSVSLLPNLWNYARCDFNGAKLLANPTQGTGNGFSVVLNQWTPYYFASNGAKTRDCSAGQMRLIAVPLPRF